MQHNTAITTSKSNIVDQSSPAAPRRGNGSLGHRWRSQKDKYHHGTLAHAAIRRGLELVGQFGPDAVTMRGVARDLGVTAAALVNYFHNRAGLRAAIANAAAEQMKPFSVVRSGGEWSGPRLHAMAGAMVDYASKNPNLYRLVYGEGWRETESPTPVRRQFVYSVDRISNMGQVSKYIRPGSNQEHAWLFHAAAHGLAMCAADRALPPALVEPVIARFVRNLYQPKTGVATTLPGR